MKVQKEVLGMLYNECISIKYGITAYNHKEGRYYILEFGEFFTEDEMREDEFKSRKANYFLNKKVI